jgi:hypothetical protein
VERQSLLDLIAFEEMTAQQDFLQNFGGKILPCEKDAKQLLIEPRIIEDWRKLRGGSFVDHTDEVFAVGCAKGIASWAHREAPWVPVAV